MLKDDGVPENVASMVGGIVGGIASLIFTALAFMWLWSVAGLGVAIIAAVFLWTIPATLGFWLGLAVVVPMLTAIGLVRKAQADNAT